MVALFFVSENIYSQDILEKADQSNQEKVAKRSIHKTRRLLNISRKQHLKALILFPVYIKAGSISQKNGSVEEFIKFLVDNGEYWGYVYTDSLDILTHIMGRRVSFYANTTPDSLAIKYIEELNPEYIFWDSFTISLQRYFCYKNKDIILVYLDAYSEKVISFPLSELKDWRCLDIRYYYDHPECLGCLKIGNASD